MINFDVAKVFDISNFEFRKRNKIRIEGSWRQTPKPLSRKLKYFTFMQAVRMLGLKGPEKIEQLK